MDYQIREIKEKRFMELGKIVEHDENTITIKNEQLQTITLNKVQSWTNNYKKYGVYVYQDNISFIKIEDDYVYEKYLDYSQRLSILLKFMKKKFLDKRKNVECSRYNVEWSRDFKTRAFRFFVKEFFKDEEEVYYFPGGHDKEDAIANAIYELNNGIKKEIN